MRQRVWLATAIVALGVSGVACASDEPAAGVSPDAGIATTLSDFAIRPAEVEAPAGSVTFDLTNEGPSDDSFLVARTDIAEDELPATDHVVDLEALEVVIQVDEVPFEAESVVSADLEAGDYVMFCALPGHYESDMHTAFTVT